jgi:ubiquinone/menaquinone biosynthesis C-methylase UbiE
MKEKRVKNKVHFWNKVADKYAKNPISDMPSYEHKLQKTREYFTPESHIVEIGCGTGSTAILHAPFVRSILAIDLSDKMLDIANKKLAETSITNIKFKNSDIDVLRLAKPVDMVMTMSLLHLLEDKEAALAKIFEGLKPGGVFVSSTACIADGMKIFKYIGPVAHFLGLIPFVKVFTNDELKRSIEAAGFEIDYAWKPDKKLASSFIIAKKPK